LNGYGLPKPRAPIGLVAGSGWAGAASSCGMPVPGPEPVPGVTMLNSANRGSLPELTNVVKVYWPGMSVAMLVRRGTPLINAGVPAMCQPKR